MCPELRELIREWMLCPGNGVWREVYQHIHECPACMAIAAKVEHHREYLRIQREVIDLPRP